MYSLLQHKPKKAPWNKGKLVGQKPPLKLKEIWAIRVRLQIDVKQRDLALFNLAIDSKLRACDLLKLRVSDVSQGNRVASPAMVMQQKTGQSVQFELIEQTRHNGLGLDSARKPELIRSSVPESVTSITPPFCTALRPHRGILGSCHWT